jgi:hypothetical protein
MRNGINFGCNSEIICSSKEEIENEFGKAVELGSPAPWYARLPAYYAKVTGEKNYAARAWDEFLNARARYYPDFTCRNMKE